MSDDRRLHDSLDELYDHFENQDLPQGLRSFDMTDVARRRRITPPWKGVGSAVVLAGTMVGLFVVLVAHQSSPGTTTGQGTSPLSSSGAPYPTALATSRPTLAATVPAGWASYTSAHQHVSFSRPANWKVVCDQPGDNWLLIDTGGTYTTCPQGDGQVGIFVVSVAGTAQPTGLSLISTNAALYTNVLRSTVAVDGVSGTRLSGDQTAGQGSGSSQVEYDFTVGGRSYYFLAVVGTSGEPTAAQFDELTRTVTFG